VTRNTNIQVVIKFPEMVIKKLTNKGWGDIIRNNWYYVIIIGAIMYFTRGLFNIKRKKDIPNLEDPNKEIKDFKEQLRTIKSEKMRQNQKSNLHEVASKLASKENDSDVVTADTLNSDEDTPFIKRKEPLTKEEKGDDDTEFVKSEMDNNSTNVPNGHTEYISTPNNHNSEPTDVGGISSDD